MPYLNITVIGAGMAGIWAAHALAADGHAVRLVDQADEIGSGASGNAAGAFHPHLSSDDNPLSRLTRIGCAATLQSLEKLTASGLLTRGKDWGQPGHLQLAKNTAESERFRQQVGRSGLAPAIVCWVDADAACRLSGLECGSGGLWFPQGGWVRPRAWLAAALRARGSAVVLQLQSRIVQLAQQPQGWTIHAQRSNGSAAPPWTADVIVIAAAEQSIDLCPWAFVEISIVKGQVSLVRLGADERLGCVLSGACYGIPLPDGEVVIGATYERPAQDRHVTRAGHAANLQRWGQTFPNARVPTIEDGRSAWRCVLPGRLPAIGAVPDANGEPISGLYVATGYGSRGLSWAVLGGQLLARLIRRNFPAAQPCLPDDALELANKMFDPARFTTQKRLSAIVLKP
ncbi:MAG: FAD-dependent 5-carboxymethylaminomethyl-2-thiouridine(34) oxidoreductase MnmC [Burkholderiaceae bacterium]